MAKKNPHKQKKTNKYSERELHLIIEKIGITQFV